MNKKTAAEPSARIDELLEPYTGEGFAPVSFTSPQNEGIRLVQFVIKCDGIEKPQQPEAPADEPDSGTFWSRLVALFEGSKAG